MRRRRLLARLRRDRAGVTVVEFALVAPVFLLLLMGTFEIGHMAYANAVLSGAVEQAARTATIEAGDIAAADARVEDTIRMVVPDAKFAATRKSYFDFKDINRPEQWNDVNGNGDCDNDENFVDENGNGQWDADIGTGGNGGANDVVLYKVTVDYQPIFPIPFVGEQTLTATAVKKNQPFANQESYGTDAGACE
ncbi:TadE family protein [Novosphingobium aquimarinum]|uniref:TadE family protein n=1 Tax=Novosphingobium aquimarinum TaxID=2682494 RepID=UPI0012EB7501|nr:TadE family protein [Novosphingobium aquimarinum]